MFAKLAIAVVIGGTMFTFGPEAVAMVQNAAAATQGVSASVIATQVNTVMVGDHGWDIDAEAAFPEAANYIVTGNPQYFAFDEDSNALYRVVKVGSLYSSCEIFTLAPLDVDRTVGTGDIDITACDVENLPAGVLADLAAAGTDLSVETVDVPTDITLSSQE